MLYTLLAAGLLGPCIGHGVTLAQNIVDLGSTAWTLHDPSHNVSVPGSVPSHTHLDLFAAKVIDDPYYGLNEFDQRWVANSNWTYVSAPIAGLHNGSSTSTWLVFNGLDTFTDIRFCGQPVAATNNQFRQYSFDVSDIYHQCNGSAILSVNFGSAPQIVNTIAAEQGQESESTLRRARLWGVAGIDGTVAWPTGVEISYEFPNRQFMRKEQSDFGWDWGPAFSPAGIWQPAYVVQLEQSDIYIRNSLFDIYRQGQLNNLPPDQSQPWVVNASLDYLGTLPKDAGLNLRLTDANSQTIASGPLSNITVGNGSITGSTVVDPLSYELWWPRGLGPQNLYNMTVEVVGSGSTPVASVEKRVGFRTIVLNMGPVSQDEIDQGVAPGNHWHFEVNGHEFYAKGSNFIPPDAFWPRVTQAKIQQLFSSVVEGNQNMLRVWASGAYLPDFVYDVADQEGILMWSEFEFSDSLYPIDREFLDNVREEATYNVRRLNHHASLALWAGGNELESLELQLVEDADPAALPRYKSEYEALFLDVLLPVVYSNGRSISYTPSSTDNGWLTLDFSKPIPMTERYNNKTDGSIYGDTDYYNYDSSIAFQYDLYPVGRFANEFGFHSMPSSQTWQQVVPEDDLYFNSSTIQLRNRHYPPGLSTDNFPASARGMGEMTVAAQRWYPTPDKSESLANFSAWCHTTQIFQADFYKSEIQFYRRGSGMPERQLGSLYWQLEDIWQGPTWAGIEYDGRWKVLHHVAQDIYQPVIISPFYNTSTGDLQVYVTSDLWDTARGSANFTWYDWSGARLNTSMPATADVTVDALNTTKILQVNTQDLKLDYANAILVLEVSVEGSLPNTQTARTFTHQNWFHAVPLREANLVDPEITLRHNATSFTVEAQSGVAVWTWLDNPAGVVGHFDTNAFLLLPNQPRTVGFSLQGPTTDPAWASEVTVRSLWNNTIP
ncbi:MAG: hypothetical protein M1838_002866 [Thelocarpon superellum]|nr:MAG: hypothetical protein M1838_002866 [Thelocarpon superellum]